MINKSINAIILVPEITKGMKSIGSKALLNIDKNKCLIEYQIEYLQKNYDNVSIFVATGFDGDKIFKKTKCYNDVSIIHNKLYETTNQGMSLSLYLESQKDIKDTLIISNGILLKKKLELPAGNSAIYTLNKKNTDYNIGINIDNNFNYLFYDFPVSWSECVYLDKGAIEILKSINKEIFYQMFLFEVINYLLDNKCSFENKKIYNKNILKIMNAKQTKKVRQIYD